MSQKLMSDTKIGSVKYLDIYIFLSVLVRNQKSNHQKHWTILCIICANAKTEIPSSHCSLRRGFQDKKGGEIAGNNTSSFGFSVWQKL